MPWAWPVAPPVVHPETGAVDIATKQEEVKLEGNQSPHDASLTLGHSDYGDNNYKETKKEELELESTHHHVEAPTPAQQRLLHRICREPTTPTSAAPSGHLRGDDASSHLQVQGSVLHRIQPEQVPATSADGQLRGGAHESESPQHSAEEVGRFITMKEAGRFITMKDFREMCREDSGGLAGFRQFLRSKYRSPADAFAQLGGQDVDRIPLDEFKIEIIHAFGIGNYTQMLSEIDTHLARG